MACPICDKLKSVLTAAEMDHENAQVLDGIQLPGERRDGSMNESEDWRESRDSKRV
jgi:hypothetical protein